MKICQDHIAKRYTEKIRAIDQHRTSNLKTYGLKFLGL